MGTIQASDAVAVGAQKSMNNIHYVKLQSPTTYIALYAVAGLLIAIYFYIYKREDTGEKRALKALYWLLTIVGWAPVLVVGLFLVTRDAIKIRRLAVEYYQVMAQVRALDAARAKIAECLESVVALVEYDQSPADLNSMQNIFDNLKSNENDSKRAKLKEIEWQIQEIKNQSIKSDYSLAKLDDSPSVLLAFVRHVYERGEPLVRFEVPLKRYFGIEEDSNILYAPDSRLWSFEENSPDQKEEWSTYFSSSFNKDLSSLDRKLQGRVLSAIMEISKQPTVARGDTVKPLTGPLDGQWRYRLGDYRVVYLPKSESFVIVFLRCAARGNVYH